MRTKLKFSKYFVKGKAIILCFFLVSLATSVIMSPIISSSPGQRVRLPNFFVNMVETYPGAHSYFDTTLSGIGSPGTGYDVYDGTFIGWCCDEYHYIYPGTTYSIRLYSTYNPLMPWPDTDWDMVNYVLNHKDSTANKDQIQKAIWYFIDGGYSGSDPIILGMINDAIANGEDFVPQQGEICAVLCDAGPTIQHTFIEVLVPVPVCRNVEDDVEFGSIQAAIDDPGTGDGETIEVYAGLHPGNIIVYKELTIQSASGAESTIIDANTVDYSVYQNAWGKGINYAWAQTNDPGLLKNGFFVWSDNVVIDGFKIINALWPSQYNRGIGILIGSIHTTYAGFIPWNIDQWGGIVPNPDEPTPTGVIVKNNIIDAASDGIYNWASSGNTIEYNTVTNCALYGGCGIQCYEGGTDNIIRGNNVDNVAASAISICGAWPNVLLDVSNTQAYDNTLTNNNYGIQFYNIVGSGVSAYHNNIFDNNNGIVVEGVGGATVATAHNNNIVGNIIGVENTAPDGIFIATCNWWGDASGPGSIATGSGDPVSNNVEYCPWLDDQYPDGTCGGGGYIMCDIQGPFTTGPKDNYFVHLCGHCSYVNICGDITTGTSYLWDWGDGTTSTTQCADHTYDPDCPDEGGFVIYFVTFTIKYQADGFDLSCSDSAVVTVYCDDNDPPIAQLMYPTGGETISGTETVNWFALDTELLRDLPIRLYYSPAGMNNWMQIGGGVLYNNIDETHGSYNWNTNTLSDGSYKLKVVAQDNFYNIAESESKAFTINNGYAGARVSSIQIMDTSINSDSWVKDGDTIEITAGITGGSSLTREDITADLSGFGKASSVVADNYDGYVATWVVGDVTCIPSDGQIQVTVTTDGDTNTGVITADNTIPEINLVKPKTGLYLFNTRVFPMSRTVVIGEITIVVDAVDISMAEFYVDVLDGHPEGFVIQAPFSWTLNYKLKGLHTVKIRLTDFAGNMNEQSLDLFIHNPRGKPLN